MSSDFRDGVNYYIIINTFYIKINNLKYKSILQLAAVQMGPTVIHLAFFKERLINEEKVDFQFKGLATAKVRLIKI